FWRNTFGRGDLEQYQGSNALSKELDQGENIALSAFELLIEASNLSVN
ncbi:MAG: hypothetical protein F6K44_32690, partial [Moorea sp. SIO3E2]|nr:hypothetical protein [Moorena sp. SIO3E2]